MLLGLVGSEGVTGVDMRFCLGNEGKIICGVRTAVRFANAHISEARYGAPGFVVGCGWVVGCEDW